jgi:TolB-like protein
MNSKLTDRRFNSWKEIASHFNRDVRTVQRWEKEEGLPVHRKVHSKLSSIFAYESELGVWWDRGHTFESAVTEPHTEGTQRPMLVVLPLRNLSGDPEQEYFSDGFSEELIGHLSRIDPENLGVIARGSAMKYKQSPRGIDQIARQLGARYVLEGSVRRDRGRVRIAVALIVAAEQSNLWTASYDRDLSDILALQTEVAIAVASEIVAKVSSVERARDARVAKVNPEAYNAYLLGRYFWNRRTVDGIHRAITHFEESIACDPSYAAAHAGLADCLALLASVRLGMLAPNDAMPRAKAAATRAVELNPMLAEAHAALGYSALWYDWDWPAAERRLKRALELNPTYASARQWYSYYLYTTDRLDEAIAELKRALEIDPLSLQLRTTLSSLLYFERQYEVVIAQSKIALAMEPTLVLAYFNLGRAYSHSNMHRDAIADLARLARKTYVPSFYTGAIYTGLREKDRAFYWLRRAYVERCDYMVHLPKEPATDPLRSDPRFDALVPRPNAGKEVLH